MMQYAAAPQPKTYQKQYRNFRGVDLTNAITEVDESRSPYAPNLISDSSGFPEKRPGTKTVLSAVFDGPVYGIFPFVTTAGDKLLIFHAGTKLYKSAVSDLMTPTEIFSGMNEALSTYFVMRSSDTTISNALCIYILDGEHYIRYSGTGSAVEVDDDTAYIPTTTISAPPAGGGTKYESVNLLQKKRKNSILGTDGTTEYYLDTEEIDSVDLVEKMTLVDGEQTWSTISASGYTVNTTLAKITFTTAPGGTPVTGVDNLRVTFSKTVTGYANMIKKCTIAAFYGISSDNRIFLSGNDDYRNRDWQSGIANPEYFPDDGYSIVGSENSAIMGYLKQYDSLVVIKEDSDQDATMYLRTATISGSTVTYPLKQGLVGMGAASKHAFGVVADDPIFLSKNGQYGLESNAITLQRTTQLRSYYVNTELKKESGIEYAVLAIWNGLACIFINGKVYVANSQMVNKNKTGSYGYEWFIWNNIPAMCAREFDGALYYGTATGDVHRFMTYEEYGMDAYWDREEAYECAWATKMDDLGDPMRMKTILKHGSGVIAKPYVLTSGSIYYATEKDYEKYANEFDAALQSFVFGEEFTFGPNINFNAVTNPRVMPINKKLRNREMVQVIVKNTEGGKGFGILGIQLRYQYSKDVKK
jgi:hypothetical protein